MSMDMRVGVWRGKWPKDISAIIAIDDLLLVRYFRSEKLLDLIALSEDHQPPKKLGEVSLGSLELPPIEAVHHFMVRGVPFLLCIAEDRKHYAIFPLSEDRFGNATTGVFPMMSSRCVVFRYRGLHYALLYSKASGEYAVLALLQLLNQAESNAPVVVSRGKFAKGWSDIVWKGTHHVRCTRQKFFCYNASTGEVAFECVWIRGGSASSSICSQEHVTMEANSQAVESSLEHAFQRKGCLVVPLSIANQVTCLLYSHTALESKVLEQNQSTGRLLSPAQSAVSQKLMSAVAKSSSLLLQKQVFAHKDPWSHFCMAKGSPDKNLLLCYSAATGAVWISSLFMCKEPVPVVTLVDSWQVPQHGPPKESEKNGSKMTSSDLTAQALQRVEDDPVDVATFASAHPPPASEREEQRNETRSPAEREGKHQQTPKPFSPHRHRPSSSKTSIKERLAKFAVTGDYSVDIHRVLEQIQSHDFPPEAPYCQLASQLLAEEGPPHRASSARAARKTETAPWKSVFADRDFLPSEWLEKFNLKWKRHRVEEVPNLALTEEKMERLFHPAISREEWQLKQLENIDRSRKKEIVRGDRDPLTGTEARALITRLAVNDPNSREKNFDNLTKKFIFSPPKSRKFSDDAEMDHHVQHLTAESIRHKEQSVAKIRKKMLPQPPKVASPLSIKQQQTLGIRLGEAFVKKIEDSRQHIFRQMTAPHEHPAIKLSAREMELSTERLYSSSPSP